MEPSTTPIEPSRLDLDRLLPLNGEPCETEGCDHLATCRDVRTWQRVCGPCFAIARKRHNQELRAAGLCLCAEPADPDYATCTDCRERGRSRYQAKKDAEIAALKDGRCSCGKPALIDEPACDDCFDNRVDRQYRTVITRAAEMKLLAVQDFLGVTKSEFIRNAIDAAIAAAEAGERHGTT